MIDLIVRLMAAFTIFGPTSALAQQNQPPSPKPMPSLPLLRYYPDPLWKSEGFRLGFMNAGPSGIIFWTYEGNLLSGFNSSSGQLVDEFCYGKKSASAQYIRDAGERNEFLARVMKECRIEKNPWEFSFTDSRLFQRYKGLGTVPVVIYYAIPDLWFEYSWFWGLWTKTKNYIYAIYPVDPSLQIEQSIRIKVPIYEKPTLKDTFIIGRVVKASMDHLIRKTYEVIIQDGSGGNNMVQMSVDDTRVFDYLTKAMLTGRMLRIEYIQLLPEVSGWFFWFVRGYDTDYRIIGAELSHDVNVPAAPEQPAER